MKFNFIKVRLQNFYWVQYYVLKFPIVPHKSDITIFLLIKYISNYVQFIDLNGDI